MHALQPRLVIRKSRIESFLFGILTILLAWYSAEASAIPAFARQTGQNCVACHVGGQFPELTPYGRTFKLTGYTLGERTLPLSAMAVITSTNPRNKSDPNGTAQTDFPAKSGSVILNTESLFLAGKVTDNIGGFMQFTNNAYDHVADGTTSWKSKFYSDNTDLRYADRFISEDRDLIFGFSLNNNPSLTDVWNSAPAWGFDIVPGSGLGGAIGKIPTAPILNGGLSQKVVGMGSYVYWNKTFYAELANYRTANKSWSFLSHGYSTGDQSMPLLSGLAPYWRLAYTRDWDAHSIMIGAMGLNVKEHTDSTDRTSPIQKYSDVGVDAQYQYILDPHSITAELSYLRERIHYDAGSAGQPGAYDAAFGTSLQPLTNGSDKLALFRLKTSYTYRAKYGGSLSFFNLSGSYNSALQTGIAGDPTGGGTLPSLANNVTGKPDTRGWTFETFYIPVQYARVGVQYTLFNKYLGASTNYDGWGRKAKDNNSIFFYIWGVY